LALSYIILRYGDLLF